jgi:hypothetical protein
VTGFIVWSRPFNPRNYLNGLVGERKREREREREKCDGKREKGVGLSLWKGWSMPEQKISQIAERQKCEFVYRRRSGDLKNIISLYSRGTAITRACSPMTIKKLF